MLHIFHAPRPPFALAVFTGLLALAAVPGCAWKEAEEARRQAEAARAEAEEARQQALAEARLAAENEQRARQLADEARDQAERERQAAEANLKRAASALAKVGQKKDADKPPKLPPKKPADTKQVHVLEGHEGAVLCVAFSPDGKRAVTGSADKTVRLWDLKSGKELECFKGHTGEVVGVTFSPDNKHILSASADKTLRLWQPGSKKEPLRIDAHTDKITSVAFTTDGKRILSASLDRTVRVWDVEGEAPKEVSCFKGHALGVLCVAVSPDGKLAMSGGQDRTVRLWNVADGKELARHADHKGWVWSVAFSPEADAIVSGGADGKIIRHALSGNSLFGRKSTETPNGAIYAVQFYRDCGQVVTGSDDKGVSLWFSDAKAFRNFNKEDPFGSASLKNRQLFVGHTEPVRSVAVSVDGRFLLSGSDDKTARLWKLAE